MLLLERELLLALGLLEDEVLLLLERELLLALGLLEDEDLLLLERELLLALGLLDDEDLLLPERELPDLALARLLVLFDDDAPDLLEVLVSPFSARCLFTVRAAISAARPFWPRFS